MRSRWAINGRFLSQPTTGVQRVACEVVRALDALIGSDPALERSLSLELVLPPDAAMPWRLDAIPHRRAGRVRGHAWEQGVLPAHAPGGLLSLCNTGPLLHRKQIVCIHDATTRSSPDSYTFGFRALYRVLLPMLGRRARAVTTVSSYSAREIRRLGIRPSGSIRVVPNGHEHAIRWSPAHSDRTRAVAGRDTVVVIGSPAPHKNIGLLLGISERLEAAGIRLAVAGGVDPRVYASGPSPGAGVDWLGRITDAEMAALLQDSLCLAFPSLTEGFGMPPLEAMALGCPTIVSDRASLPEICGDASLYAPASDPEAWFSRICELRHSHALRQDLAGRGKVQAARFRWSDAAAAYLEIMASLDGQAKPAAARPRIARPGASPCEPVSRPAARIAPLPESARAPGGA